MIPHSAAAAAPRLFRTASTNAPAGNWLIRDVIVPSVSTNPMSTCVHLLVVR